MSDIFETTQGGYLISTDPHRLDPSAVHKYLVDSYWAKGIPLETVTRALYSSLCFGLYYRDRQVGLARVVSDYTTFAYLCDVYVATRHRGQGLGTWLMQCVMTYPNLQNLRRFMLVTRDAHKLYRRFGFQTLLHPEFVMEIHNENIYQRH